MQAGGVRIIVTDHAVERYRERVADLPDRAIRAALSSDAFEAAARFGAPFVKLPTGQRALIRDYAVVTVLPKNTRAGVLATEVN